MNRLEGTREVIQVDRQAVTLFQIQYGVFRSKTQHKLKNFLLHLVANVFTIMQIHGLCYASV